MRQIGVGDLCLFKTDLDHFVRVLLVHYHLAAELLDSCYGLSLGSGRLLLGGGLGSSVFRRNFVIAWSCSGECVADRN